MEGRWLNKLLVIDTVVFIKTLCIAGPDLWCLGQCSFASSP